MATKTRLSRRSALKLGAAAAALPLVHIRTAGAAGKLKVGMWDHWVPAGNAAMKKQVDAWSAKSKVEVELDFITSNGNKLLTTGVAEATAKTGHDIFTFYSWDAYNVKDQLEPVDDVMAHITGQGGAADPTASYLGKVDGHWIAVPTSSGTQNKPPCARISWFKKQGLDLQALYPVKPEATPGQAQWDYDALLKYAEAAAKDGMTFGMGFGGSGNTDATDQIGAMFHAFGANLMDMKGNVLVKKSPEVMAVMEYAQKLVKFLPAEAQSYDDASNNRALISGKSALIFNPPSAWAVAKRDAPKVAEDCWTFSAPVGPKGRYVPTAVYFWGLWKFSTNKGPAKDLMMYLMDKAQVEQRDIAVDGYDIPPYAGMLDFKVWETVGPPTGTNYNYPIRPWHHALPSLTASETTPDIAVQIYRNAIHNGMLARLKTGQKIPEILSWASDQLEGFTR